MKLMTYRAAALALTILAAPAFAQGSAEPNMADMLNDIGVVAGNLQASIGNMTEGMEEAATSREDGARILYQVLAAARAVDEQLGEGSDVWMDLDGLLETWTANRDTAREAGETNDQMNQIADLWQERIDEAQTLQNQIIEQSARSGVLVAQLENQREFILAMYDVATADMVLAQMQQVSSELGEMNASMEAILAQAGTVAGEPAISNQ